MRTAPRLIRDSDWTRMRRWYAKYGRHNLPWRTKRSAWSVFVAETLLRRTRASTVGDIFPRLINEFPSPLSVTKRKGKWRTLTYKLGLPLRSKDFFSTCQLLTRQFHGSVPLERTLLEKLPGVGHYTAAAVRCFGFGIPEIIVDTNTIRVASRLGGFVCSQIYHRARATQKLVSGLSSVGDGLSARDNFAILDLAALICTPRAPRCASCPLSLCCKSAGKI